METSAKKIISERRFKGNEGKVIYFIVANMLAIVN